MGRNAHRSCCPWFAHLQDALRNLHKSPSVSVAGASHPPVPGTCGRTPICGDWCRFRAAGHRSKASSTCGRPRGREPCGLPSRRAQGASPSGSTSRARRATRRGVLRARAGGQRTPRTPEGPLRLLIGASFLPFCTPAASRGVLGASFCGFCTTGAQGSVPCASLPRRLTRGTGGTLGMAKASDLRKRGTPSRGTDARPTFRHFRGGTGRDVPLLKSYKSPEKLHCGPSALPLAYKSPEKMHRSRQGWKGGDGRDPAVRAGTARPHLDGPASRGSPAQ